MSPEARLAPFAVDVVPATEDRWADIATILGGDGDRGCWCLYWRQSAADYSHTPLETAARRDRNPRILMRLDLTAG